MSKNSSPTGFTELTREKINHYVYCLVDPRDNRIFYIGMGQGNRMFDHAKAALANPRKSDKLDLIREIINDKKHGAVKYYVLRHGIPTKTQAAEIESVLIDLLTSPLSENPPKMTVEMKGWDTLERGMKSIDELEAQYSAHQFELQVGDFPVFLNIHKTFSSEENFDIYKAVRSSWNISKTNRDRITHVLAVYHNIVRGVYRPEKWSKAGGTKNLWEFDGVEDKKSPYRYTNVKDIIKFNPKGIGYYKGNAIVELK